MASAWASPMTTEPRLENNDKYVKQLLATLRKQVVAEIDAAFDQIRKKLPVNSSEMLEDVIIEEDVSQCIVGSFNVDDEPETKAEHATDKANNMKKVKADDVPVHSWSTNNGLRGAAIDVTDDPDVPVLICPPSPKAAPTAPMEKRTKGMFSKAGEDRDCDAIEAVFNKLDVDGNHDVTKAEFLRAFKTDDAVRSFCAGNDKLCLLLDPKTFKQAFSIIDSDSNANISLSEFREAIDRLSEQVTREKSAASERHTVADLMGGRGAFQQADMFKSGALDKEVYDVTNFYKTDGVFQKVARTEFFQNFTLVVIVANAIYLGVDADHNNADKLFEANAVFIVFEFLVFAYFLFEWVIRFGAFQRKIDGLKDGWFKFDSFLVFLMLVETLVVPMVFADSAAPPTGPLRLLRLLRLSRIVRLLRSFPELATMVKAIVAALRAVLSSFIMVVVLIYVFAIILKIFLGEDEVTEPYFSTLGLCMWTLLIDGVMGDSLGTVMDLLIHRGTVNTTIGVVVFFIFILLAVVTVMNMVIGVLCEVVGAVTAAEKEQNATNLMKQTILVELKKFDDGDGEISEEELNELMTEAKSVDVLETLGVDVTFLQTLQVMTYEAPGKTVAIPDLLEQMLMCREDTAVTMKHLILQQQIAQWTISNKIMQLERRMDKKLNSRFEMLLDEIELLVHESTKFGNAPRATAPQRVMYTPPPAAYSPSRPMSAISHASWL
jgi:hypothetical protein